MRRIFVALRPGLHPGRPIRDPLSRLLLLALILSACGGKPAPSGGNAATPSSSPGESPTRPAERIPVTWSALHLTGKLIYLAAYQAFNNPYVGIQDLDLATGEVTTIFQTPPNGWVYGLSISPDDRQLVISYATPTAFPVLYTMPLDGSEAPQPLFTPPTQDDQYLEPAWSPDGHYIYFVHVNNRLPSQEPGQQAPVEEIDRVAVPAGKTERILEKASWPRLSADSSRMVFVSENAQDGTNHLLVAHTDGSALRPVLLSDSYVPEIIDAPFFSPDRRSILFSAPGIPASAGPSPLEKLLGIIVVEAHGGVAEDWWQVPAEGGLPTQLTHLQTPGLYASGSPDGRYVASTSAMGLFVMNPDGTGLTMLVNDLGGISGSVSWIP